MNPDLPPPDKKTASVEAALATLKGAGLRITQPRVVLLTLLCSNSTPAPIHALHAELKKNHHLDLVTVYRCLAAFEELGLVRRLYTENGTFLWQFVSKDASPYQIISKVTADSEPLDSELTDQVRSALNRVEEVLKSRGYTDINHKVQFFGVKPGGNEST